MTLAEFILARIAEDETEAHSLECPCDLTFNGTHAPICPERVLAQCEAFRRILRIHATGSDGRCGECSDRYSVTPWDGLCDEAKALAAIWSDHPDYRAEWAA